MRLILELNRSDLRAASDHKDIDKLTPFDFDIDHDLIHKAWQITYTNGFRVVVLKHKETA